MTIKPSTLRNWQRIGQRGIYGTSLLEASISNSSVFAISADLGNSSGLDRFKRELPDRFLNIGISEQHMIGFASGLSSLGFNVFVSSFAPFLTLRAGEQVRMNLAYMRSNVKLVSIGSGISMGYLGNSHFGLEDLSIIRSFPNIPIFQPSDCYELHQVVQYLSGLQGPAYLRLTGIAPNPSIHNIDYQFDPNSYVTHRSGSDLLVLSSGSILSSVIAAADSLESNSVTVCSLPRIWPLPSSLSTLIANYTSVLIVDEHSSTGGLFSIIISELARIDSSLIPRIHNLSLPSTFLDSGTYEDLLAKYHLNVPSISSKMSTLF